jgi:hypothetical protein
MPFDLWTDWDPSWVMAVLSLPTLLAAVGAGIFAWRAAHWTKQQSIAANTQVDLAKEGLLVAKGDAESARAESVFQRSETNRANRRQAEMRLDTMAPAILAKAEPREPLRRALEWRPQAAEGITVAEWTVPDQSFTVPDDQIVQFRTVLNITFWNVSDQIALVDVVDPKLGEIAGVRQGESLIIAPHDKRLVQWSRQFSSRELSTQEQIDDPGRWLFNLNFWARDIGMNVRDTYTFNGDLRYFMRDGSRLQVTLDPPLPWSENVAMLSTARLYERLDLLPVEDI